MDKLKSDRDEVRYSKGCMWAILRLVSIVTLIGITCQAQPVASTIWEKEYVKPDPCFWEDIDISRFRIITLSDLVSVLENAHGMRCARILISGNILKDYKYDIRIRKTRGPVLELLRDAIRKTDLTIEIVPPSSVLVYRRNRGNL